MIPSIIILILLILNGIFVAAEFALLGVSRAALNRKAAAGHGLALRLSGIVNCPTQQDQYIATAQLGITLASLGLGMYGEHTLAVWLQSQFAGSGLSQWIAAHSLATILSVTFLTYLHVVLGEMIPKSLSLLDAEKSLYVLYWPIRITRLTLAPFVFVLNSIGNALLRIWSIDAAAAHAHIPSLQELQIIVSESQERGMLGEHSGTVLQDLLGFSELTAVEAMVPRVRIEAIPIDASVDQLKESVKRRLHSRYPVYDGTLDRIVGQLHIKDILKLVLEARPLAPDDVRPVPYVPYTVSLDSILATMRSERAQLVVVIDEHGGTAGIITIEDLFEEVVGEVAEGERDSDWIKSPDGSVSVAGTDRLFDLQSEFGFELEHPEVDTISGLILSVLGRPPIVGDSIRYEGLQFTVTEVVGRGVGKCVVRLEADGSEQPA